MYEFGLLNWIILSSYAVGSIILGFYLNRRVQTAEHYYLGDRSTPWWAIGLSVMATYTSAFTFLGAPAWAYTEGFSVIFIHINYPIAVFIVISVFIPFFYNSGVASIFEYLERRFGRSSRLVMSSIFLLGNIIYSGIILYTTALVIEFITGTDVVTAITVVSVIAMTYTLLGGISAVIWTDVAQTIILLSGAAIVLFLLIIDLPLPLSETLLSLKSDGRLNPFEFSLSPDKVATVWTGVIAMSIYHVVVYGVNQMMIQRTLVAKTIGDAKKAYTMMGYAAFFIFTLLFSLGIFLYAFFEGASFDNTNTIMLEFVKLAGVPGLMGLIAVAIVAAAMSSLDSSLNSMATVTNIDFYQQYFKKDASPQHLLRAARVFTVMWGLFVIGPAILFTASDGSVLETLSKIGSFFVGSKLSMYFLGFYSKHTTERGLLMGVAAGFLTLLYVEYFMNVAWPWYCAIGGFVSVTVGWISSIVIDGFQSEYHVCTVRGQKKLFEENGLPLKQNGWYILPGKVDSKSYGLIIFFFLCVLCLYIFYQLI